MVYNEAKKIAITGRPGIGKSTLCLNVYKKLKDDVKCGGFVTYEVREGGKRVGFKVFDLTNCKEFWLASISPRLKSDVKIGKYYVFVDEFNEYVKELAGNSNNFELLIVDEVGPMELKSKNFIEFVNKTMNSKINCLFTVHMKSKHYLIKKIKEEFRVYTLTESNRNLITKKVLEELKGET